MGWEGGVPLNSLVFIFFLSLDLILKRLPIKTFMIASLKVLNEINDIAVDSFILTWVHHEKNN